MAKKTRLRIWTIFDPTEAIFLRTPAQPLDVPEISLAENQQLIDDMHTTMRQAEGIGLAAPQVGQGIRIAVIARQVDSNLPVSLTLINPVIAQPSTLQLSGEEGCLSIPGVFGMVDRADTITVRFFDRQGQPQTLQAHGLLARVVQHEVDHLNGILFIDRHPEFTRGRDLLP